VTDGGRVRRARPQNPTYLAGMFERCRAQAARLLQAPAVVAIACMSAVALGLHLITDGVDTGGSWRHLLAGTALIAVAVFTPVTLAASTVRRRRERSTARARGVSGKR
jgi:hypothetical protein